jgi:hypothetical protein
MTVSVREMWGATTWSTRHAAPATIRVMRPNLYGMAALYYG